MKRILVALDDTEASRRVAQFVNELFVGDGYEIIGLNVSPASVRFDVASVWLKPDGSASVELFEDAF